MKHPAKNKTGPLAQQVEHLTFNQVLFKERPLIISTQLIPATLDGRKTQTRRVIKHPERLATAVFESQQYAHALCPYGQVGDRLWVKETSWISDCGKYRCYINHASGDIVSKQARYTDKGIHRIYGFSVRSRPDPDKRGYAFKRFFGDVDEDEHIVSRIEAEFHKKQSSLFMPRWASRITLEITGVRVERLQEISKEDAVKEGILLNPHEGRYACVSIDSEGQIIGGGHYMMPSPLPEFKILWDSLNAKRGYNYDEEYWGNPKIKDGYHQVRFEPAGEYRKVYLRNSEWGITWGWDEYDDPEALELDIRPPESIDIIDSHGTHHHLAKLIRKVRTKGIYSWEANPWVWVISFKPLETSYLTITPYTPKRGSHENIGGNSYVHD